MKLSSLVLISHTMALIQYLLEFQSSTLNKAYDVLAWDQKMKKCSSLVFTFCLYKRAYIVIIEDTR